MAGRAWRQRVSQQARQETGETYIEILICLVIVGLVVAAILGSLLTSISSSEEHRNLSTDDAQAKSALEAIKSDVQLTTSPAFEDCYSPTTNTPTKIQSDWSSIASLPSNVKLTGVECWNPTLNSGSGGFDPSCSTTLGHPYTTGCTSNDTSGMIRATVSVTDSSGYVTSLSTIVRNPTYESVYSGLYP